MTGQLSALSMVQGALLVLCFLGEKPYVSLMGIFQLARNQSLAKASCQLSPVGGSTNARSAVEGTAAWRVCHLQFFRLWTSRPYCYTCQDRIHCQGWDCG